MLILVSAIHFILKSISGHKLVSFSVTAYFVNTVSHLTCKTLELIAAWEEEKVYRQETCCFFYIGQSKSAWSSASCWWIWKCVTARTNLNSGMHLQVFFHLNISRCCC